MNITFSIHFSSFLCSFPFSLNSWNFFFFSNFKSNFEIVQVRIPESYEVAINFNLAGRQEYGFKQVYQFLLASVPLFHANFLFDLQMKLHFIIIRIYLALLLTRGKFLIGFLHKKHLSLFEREKDYNWWPITIRIPDDRASL